MFTESYPVLGNLINTQYAVGNKTDWVLAFMTITAQPGIWTRKKHKTLSEALPTD